MFVKDKQFYKTFAALTAMIAVQNLLAFGVNMADNMMLGRYSETSIAAASLVNQIQYLLQMVSVNGIGTGALAIVAQYWGKGEAEPVRRVIALMVKFAAFVGVLFWAVTFFFPKEIVGLMTDKPAVIDEGAEYLRLMCFTYIAFPVQSALVMSLRGVKIANIGPFISAVSLLINIALNWVFIYGNLGAPEMGIAGAAAATLIARALELIITLVYVRFFDKKLRIRLLSFFKPDMYYFKDFTKAALPVIGSAASWGIGTIMQTVILGHLTETVIAANSITVVFHQVLGVYALGANWTCGVMIGNIVGAGRTELVRPYTRTLQLLCVLNGLLSSLVFFTLRDFVLGFYILTPETENLARAFITVQCVTIIGTAYLFPMESGIILGGGNTRYAFFVDTLFIWLWVLPASALSAFVFRFPHLVTFMLLKSDQFLKCIPNAITVNRYRWIRDLTRETPPE
ncbi:MAG: MATE family efflux transporter [Oscillospiraceae bacterium]|nr:MATE family efflux transporter [Oscillospiraceae bacterium]